MSYQYNPSEQNLPKWVQELIGQLRVENINMRAAASGIKVAQIVKLDQDWFVMPGPNAGEPAVRLWVLGEQGPQMIGTLAHGTSLMMQLAKESEGSE